MTTDCAATNSYLFYDLETSGLNKCFDQVVQFAAIRTDLDFHELEQYEFWVKLNPDIIPSPSAFLTHHIAIKNLEKKGKSEYEVITTIHRLFNQPGTISVGYNTLGFDDEFLRFSFYRNLLEPYRHQYANGCARLDIYPITVLYHLFKPMIINWPEINGVKSLRLEHLAAANHFEVGRAHNALADVKATIELAKRLKNDQATWDYVTNFFAKKCDMERFNRWQRSVGIKPGILISGKFGRAKNYASYALCLGMHRHYRNQIIWWPIDQKIIGNSADKIAVSDLITLHKRFGEPPLLLPALERFTAVLTTEQRNIVEHNLTWLRNHPDFVREMQNYHLEYTYPYIENLDLDGALYQDGFLIDAERMRCERFHQLSLPDKMLFVDNFSPKVRNQAIRLLGRNFSPAMKDSIVGRTILTEFTAYLNQIREQPRIDFRGDFSLTLEDAKRELASLALTNYRGDIIEEIEALGYLYSSINASV